MADPRGGVSFEGLAEQLATFKSDNVTITYSATAENGSASVGLAVTMTSDDTVKLIEADEMVLGKLISVENDNRCTVQWFGGMTLPAGDSATVTVGTKIVGALGAASAKGYVKTVAAAATPTAAEVNAIGKARGVIINNDTTTALQILLF